MDKIINIILAHETHEKIRNYFPDKFTRRSVHIQALDGAQSLRADPV